MTIQAVSRKAGPYAGNGVTMSFPFSFQVRDKTYLSVVRTDSTGAEAPLVLDTHYSVALNADQVANPGGSVTYPLTGSALAVGAALTVTGSEQPASQETDLTNGGGFFPDTLEQRLDYITTLIQQHDAILARSVKGPPSDAADLDELPVKSLRAGKFMAFDANGDPTVSTGSGGGDTSLRTDLANGAAGPGSDLIGFRRTQAEITVSVVPTNYTIPSHEQVGLVLPTRYGGVSDNVTISTTALQNALLVCAQSKCPLYLGGGSGYVSDANLNVPIGTTNGVDVIGSGWANGGLRFTGAAVTTGLTFAGSAFDYCGTVRDLRIYGSGTAKRGLTFSNVNHPRAERVHIWAFDGCGVKYDGTLMGAFIHSLVMGCGNATNGSVEVDDSSNIGSTTFLWDHSRISGGNTTVGGLLIDKTSDCVRVIGGAIESVGAPIKLSSKATTIKGVKNVTIDGIDLENPGNNPWIEIGAGLSGGALAIDVTIHQVAASPGVTATVPHFVRAQNITGLNCSDNHFTLGAAPTSCHELVGTAISGVRVQPHRNLTSLAVPWARYNGAQLLSWSAHLDCRLGKITSGGGSVPVCTHRGLDGLYTGATLAGATPSILINATHGGFYASVEINNGGAVTITSLSGGEIGMEIILLSINANTTLTFGNSGGAFRTISGANLVMVGGRPYKFYNDGSNNSAGGSCWCQVA